MTTQHLVEKQRVPIGTKPAWHDMLFRRCDIFGPAVVVGASPNETGLVFQRCQLPPVEQFLLPLHAWEGEATQVVGVVRLANVRFEECRFFGVSLLCPPSVWSEVCLQNILNPGLSDATIKWSPGRQTEFHERDQP